MTARRWLLAGCAMGLFASAQAASAQTERPDFTAILDQDVAAGRLTADQASDLKTQYGAVLDRFEANVQRAGDTLTGDVRRNVTDNPELIGQLQTLSNGQVATSPAEIHDQATAVYNGGEKLIQLQRNVIDSVRPVLVESTADFDRVVAERTDLINANPNVSASDRHDAQRLATQVHGWATYSVDHNLSTDLAKINAAESDYQSHKAEIVSGIASTLKTNADKYGPAIANWPKPAAPAPAATPTAARPAPASPSAQPARPAAVAPAAATPAHSSAPATTPSHGTVPQSGADPALSATRDTGGTVTRPGSGSATAPGTAAAPAAASHATAAAPQAATATPHVAAPRPTTPPPAPKTNPLDAIHPVHLTPMTVAAPPPERPSDKADDTAVTLRDPNAPPPSNPDGRGANPDAQPPASNDAPPVALPSATPTSDLPAPVHPRRGTIPSDAPDPAFDAHRNDPDYDPNAPPSSQNAGSGQVAPVQNRAGTDTVADGTPGGQLARPDATTAAQAAAGARGGAMVSPAQSADASDAALGEYVLRHRIPGNAHIVDGEPEFGDDVAGLRAMLPPSLAGTHPAPSVEYGGTLTVATLSPIYAGYDLNAHPGAAMRSLDLHAPVPSGLMVVPSNQINVPSTWVNVPSTWADMPSLVMMSLDVQPALCGR